MSPPGVPGSRGCKKEWEPPEQPAADSLCSLPSIVCWLLFALSSSEWFLIIDASFSFYLVLATARKGSAFLHQPCSSTAPVPLFQAELGWKMRRVGITGGCAKGDSESRWEFCPAGRTQTGETQ